MRLATFNARAETVATKPMFRDAFKSKRCLIPASGYYEWHDAPGGNQPYYFTLVVYLSFRPLCGKLKVDDRRRPTRERPFRRDRAH
jgi:hypothetical protein